MDKQHSSLFLQIVFLLIIMAVVGSIFWRGCPPPQYRSEYYDAETTQYGVIVHGHLSYGWIKNTNNFPVRINQVWNKPSKQVLSKIFEPGEVETCFFISQDYFEIYQDGEKKGAIITQPNGPPGKVATHKIEHYFLGR